MQHDIISCLKWTDNLHCVVSGLNLKEVCLRVLFFYEIIKHIAVHVYVLLQN